MLLFLHSLRRMFSAQDEFQGIGGVAFGLVDSVDVAVGGFELGVSEAARGEMVRFMAEIGAQHPEQIKEFGRGYRFDEKRSTDTEYVFIRNTDKHIVLGVENQGTL